VEYVKQVCVGIAIGSVFAMCVGLMVGDRSVMATGLVLAVCALVVDECELRLF
jgi:uncharacterized membrane protein YgaE (UPF0421/DUF939 family)